MANQNGSIKFDPFAWTRTLSVTILKTENKNSTDRQVKTDGLREYRAALWVD